MRARIEGLHQLGQSQQETIRFVEDIVSSTMTTEEKEMILRKLDNILIDTVLKFRLQNMIKNKEIK